METAPQTEVRVIPWNKGKLLGQKPPLKLKEIWAIRIRLQLDHRMRELALFNLAIDSKLRSCDLVGLRVHDVVQGTRVAAPCDCHAGHFRRTLAVKVAMSAGPLDPFNHAVSFVVNCEGQAPSPGIEKKACLACR